MKTVVVLGMHRSATSLVARGLASEIYMGPELSTSAQADQPRGHFESQRFVDLNDAILEAAGGSWFDPPPEFAVTEAGRGFRGRIARELEAAGQGRSIWGWKDPRTTLTVRCYAPLLQGPIYVACFRKPDEVIQSLHRRAGDESIGFQGWAELVTTYNDRLAAFLDDVRKGRA